MFLSFLALVSSNNCKSCQGQPENMSQILVGSWNISSFEYDENGIEVSGKVFPIEFKADQNGLLSGELMGEDEDGVFIPVSTVQVQFDAANKNMFTISTVENEEAKEFASVKVLTGLDNAKTASGLLNDKSVFSAVIISPFNVHITVLDQETKKTVVYRMSKPQPEQKQNMLTTFLPMILMMVVQFFMKGKQPQAGARQPQEGAPKEKTD